MGYKISNKALEDIENIWLYSLEHWPKEQADRYTNLIFDEIEYVALHPTVGKDFNDVRKNYRYSKVKSHLIFFRQLDNAHDIEIIRVLHEKMDIENRLND